MVILTSILESGHVEWGIGASHSSTYVCKGDLDGKVATLKRPKTTSPDLKLQTMIIPRYFKWQFALPLVSIPIILFLGQGFHRYTDGTLTLPRFGFPRRRPLETVLAELFQPILHPVTAANFTDAGGTTYTNNQTIWKKRLGKKVLILDIEMHYPQNLFVGSKRADWEAFGEGDVVAQAVMNHYTYGTCPSIPNPLAHIHAQSCRVID